MNWFDSVLREPIRVYLYPLWMLLKVNLQESITVHCRQVARKAITNTLSNIYFDYIYYYPDTISIPNASISIFS